MSKKKVGLAVVCAAALTAFALAEPKNSGAGPEQDVVARSAPAAKAAGPCQRDSVHPVSQLSDPAEETALTC